MTADLEREVLDVLRNRPEGLSEFALFAALAERGLPEFERDVFADSLRMFRSHFVLFHVLYVLRERLLMEQGGHLQIEPLTIKLTGWHADAPADVALGEHDPLRDYYLDRGNLDDMTEESLKGMLGSFWARLHAGGGRTAALRVLGLDESASWDDVRSRFRALAFEHHPDRGGDPARLVEINAAMRVLEVIRR